MTVSPRKMLLLAAAALRLSGGLLWNGTTSSDSGSGLVGRGPHRAATDADELCRRRAQDNASGGCRRRCGRRRGVAGAYYGSSCVQVVDAYGQVVTRC